MTTLVRLATLAIIMLPAAHMATAQDRLAPLPADGFVSLETIVNDFATSPEDALAKYNGMRICVHGRVGSLSQADDDQGDPLAVTMQLVDRTTPDVKAIFTADNIPGDAVLVANDGSRVSVYHRDWNGNLSTQTSFIVAGEDVAIRGTFDNFVAGDIILKNCFKLSPEALAAKLPAQGEPTE